MICGWSVHSSVKDEMRINVSLGEGKYIFSRDSPSFPLRWRPRFCILDGEVLKGYWVGTQKMRLPLAGGSASVSRTDVKGPNSSVVPAVRVLVAGNNAVEICAHVMHELALWEHALRDVAAGLARDDEVRAGASVTPKNGLAKLTSPCFMQGVVWVRWSKRWKWRERFVRLQVDGELSCHKTGVDVIKEVQKCKAEPCALDVRHIAMKERLNIVWVQRFCQYSFRIGDVMLGSNTEAKRHAWLSTLSLINAPTKAESK